MPFHNFKDLRIFVKEILKSQKIFFFWEGQERVSKLGDFISRWEYHRYELACWFWRKKINVNTCKYGFPYSGPSRSPGP
jgi:hypothetical protein